MFQMPGESDLFSESTEQVHERDLNDSFTNSTHFGGGKWYFFQVLYTKLETHFHLHLVI